MTTIRRSAGPVNEQYLVVLEVRYRGGELTQDQLGGLADALLDVADQDPTITEPDVAASLRDGALDVQMAVAAPDQAEASAKALATVRTAIHVTGGATPGGAGWEATHGRDPLFDAVVRVAPVADVDRILAGD